MTKKVRKCSQTHTPICSRFCSKTTASSVGSIYMFPNASTQQAVALGTGSKVEFATHSIGNLSKILDTWIGKDQEALAVKDVNGNTKTYIQFSERVIAISAALLRSGTAASCPICVCLTRVWTRLPPSSAFSALAQPMCPCSTNERLGDIPEEFVQQSSSTMRRPPTGPGSSTGFRKALEESDLSP